MLGNALDQGTPQISTPWILFGGYLFQECSSPQLLTYTSPSIVVVEGPFYFVLLLEVLILLVQVIVFALNLHHDFIFLFTLFAFYCFFFVFVISGPISMHLSSIVVLQ
jgi:uncharacterized membrane protein YcgQ (UPF0703/DUF1980 family)